jgi:hypothetical protein
MLVQVLQEDCGVRYNKERVRDIDFTNSKDLFLHGMVGSDNGGTCVSMPVLYVAVGRRLGYPMFLVLAKGHVFARWDDSKSGERFNIEGSGEGFSSYPDDHYKAWPMKMTETEAKAGNYLTSLSPARELAVFLAARGHCLGDTRRLPEARVAYAQAHRFDPKSPEYLGFLAYAAGGGTGVAGSRRSVRQDPVADLREIQALNAHSRRLLEDEAANGAMPMQPLPGQLYPPTPALPGYAARPGHPVPRGQTPTRPSQTWRSATEGASAPP